jgi:hypothetical protein
MPSGCEDWATYRYFDNERSTEGMILEGKFAATARRAARQEGMVPCHLLGKAAPMVVWSIHAREIDPIAGREALEWRLITDVPVETLEDAVRMLRWYALRWRIETVHKTLQSNRRVEDSGLQTAERLTRLAAVCCVASWRMFWLTMVHRRCPEAPATTALTAQEVEILGLLAKRKGRPPPKSIHQALIEIARLGGYLARRLDKPPGNTLLWRGWNRFQDLVLAAELFR